ncbi:hypothetical protein AB1N83_008516 [Pleurotus pulmonarius]
MISSKLRGTRERGQSLGKHWKTISRTYGIRDYAETEADINRGLLQESKSPPSMSQSCSFVLTLRERWPVQGFRRKRRALVSSMTRAEYRVMLPEQDSASKLGQGNSNRGSFDNDTDTTLIAVLEFRREHREEREGE